MVLAKVLSWFISLVYVNTSVTHKYDYCLRRRTRSKIYSLSTSTFCSSTVIDKGLQFHSIMQDHHRNLVCKQQAVCCVVLTKDRSVLKQCKEETCTIAEQKKLSSPTAKQVSNYKRAPIYWQNNPSSHLIFILTIQYMNKTQI